MIKAKSIDLNDFFIQVLLNGKAEVEINKVQIMGSTHKYPKTLSLQMNSTVNGYEGCGSSVHDFEEACSLVRDRYRHYTGHELPETTPPPSRVWYVHIVRGLMLPIFIGPYRPNLEDYLLTNDQTGLQEYCFKVQPHLVQHYGFDCEDGYMYFPKHTVWERNLTDYIAPVLAYTDTSHL